MLSLVLFASALLSGCSGDVHKTEIRHLVGVSMADVSIRWREVLKEELEEYSKDIPGTRFIFRNASGSAARQKEDIEHLLENGIDLLIVTPADVEQLTPVIAKVYEQIPVIVMNRGVEGFDYTEFIGPDNVLVGEQGAVLVEDIIRQSNYKGILEVGEASYISEERSKAFEQHINNQGYYSSKLLLRQPGKDYAEDRLLASPAYLSGVGVIFAHSDMIAQGVWQALKEMNRTDIAIVAVDDSGDARNLSLLEEGAFSAVIECPTGSREAVDAAVSYLQDGEQLPQKLILRSTPVLAEEVDAYLEETGGEKELPEDQIHMGYVQIREDTAFRAASTDSILNAAARENIDLTLTDTEPDLASQKAQVRAFIRKGMDIIAVSPVVSEGWEDVLEEAKTAKIPVIMCDRDVDAPIDLYSCFIGADFAEEGKKCADWLINELAGTGKVQVLELLGTKGSSPARDRQAGFEEELERDENFSVCARLQADFDFEKGKEAVTEHLLENGLDFDAIYAHNDDMALGAIEALEDYGVLPGRDVLILSVDGSRGALDQLQNGKINAVAECSPLLGNAIMKEAEELLSGNKKALKILTNEQFFTQQTDESLLKNRQY